MTYLLPALLVVPELSSDEVSKEANSLLSHSISLSPRLSNWVRLDSVSVVGHGSPAQEFTHDCSPVEVTNGFTAAYDILMRTEVLSH